MALEAPSASTLLLDGRFDPAVTALVVGAGALYARGVRRLGRREPPRSWPTGRTASFGAGLAVLVIATQSGIARYEDVLLSVHTIQHILIGMVAPLLLCLGAPVTLALQTARRPTKVGLLRVLHHPVSRLLSHPLVVWVLFGGTLFVLYLSPLLALSQRNGLVHAAVHEHFLVVGVLFCWIAVGPDPSPRPLAHPARLLFVLLAVPFHAFLGVTILSSHAALGGDGARPAWAPTAAADQATAAGILWALGDVFGLVLGGIVLVQWIAADEREQQREDRLLDAQALRSAAPAARR